MTFHIKNKTCYWIFFFKMCIWSCRTTSTIKKSKYLMGKIFCGNWFSRFFLHFTGINFYEFGFTEDFAGINFHEFRLTKDFAGMNCRESALFKDFTGVNLTFHNLSLWFWEQSQQKLRLFYLNKWQNRWSREFLIQKTLYQTENPIFAFH